MDIYQGLKTTLHIGTFYSLSNIYFKEVSKMKCPHHNIRDTCDRFNIVLRKTNICWWWQTIVSFKEYRSIFLLMYIHMKHWLKPLIIYLIVSVRSCINYDARIMVYDVSFSTFLFLYSNEIQRKVIYECFKFI